MAPANARGSGGGAPRARLLLFALAVGVASRAAAFESTPTCSPWEDEREDDAACVDPSWWAPHLSDVGDAGATSPLVASFARGLRSFLGVASSDDPGDDASDAERVAAARREAYPLPPDGVESVLLTSEANVGDPGVLLPLVLSFRKHHDPATDAIVLLSTASTPAKRAEWTAWGAKHGVLVGFVPPAHPEIVIGRFFSYRAYLQELLVHRPNAKRVAVTDATDVIFQRRFTPRIPTDRVAFVAEPEHTRVGQCAHHRRWIEGCRRYGPPVFARVRDAPRVCAGTIFGGAAPLEAFLGMFTSELVRTDYCNDQGVLNVMVHTGALGPNLAEGDGVGDGVGDGMLVWRHEDGPVLSLNTARQRDDRARVREAPVLHFGHTQAWVAKYLADAGAALKREWRANGERMPTVAPRDERESESAEAKAAEQTDAPSGEEGDGDGGGDGGSSVSFSVAFYVEAVRGDPGVAVEAIKSIRRLYPRAPAMVISAPGEDYTELCARYVCVAEVWSEKMEEEEEDPEGGETALGRGNSRGRAAAADSPPTTDTAAAAFVADPAPAKFAGDVGDWASSAGDASDASDANAAGGPPEICGSGAARAFVGLIRSAGRWASSAGAEWLVLVDPSTRLVVPVTRLPAAGADAAGANDAHWTRALTPALRKRAEEVSGRAPEYHHGGLCGGAALRARTLAEGRVPKLSALKRLDDRVDWWHDVALAAFFMFNGARSAPWDDVRENGHPRPDFGPTAFERLGKDEANAAPLAAEDARLYRRVDPETHRGYAPDADAIYDPAKVHGRAAESRDDRPEVAGANPEREPPRAATEEALPWDATAIREVDDDDPSRARWSGEVGDVDALAAALGIEPFRVDRAAVGLDAAPDEPDVEPDETLVRADTKRSSDESTNRADPNADPNEGPSASGSEGYFLIALGPSFVDEAARLVRTIRTRGEDSRPAAVLVRPEDAALARAKGDLFDRVVVYDASDKSSDGLDASARTDHERFNIVPRLRAFEYAPYDAFVMLDTDVLCSAPTERAWAAFRGAGSAVAAPGLSRDCGWHFGRACDVSSKMGIEPPDQLPHVHAGAVYVNRAGSDPAALAKFAADAAEAFLRYDDFGFARLFRQESRVLEICMSLAFHRAGFVPLDFYRFPIINFNVRADEKLPSNAQRLGGHPQRASDDGSPYPFTHYFVKAGFAEDYERQYAALTASS